MKLYEFHQVSVFTAEVLLSSGPLLQTSAMSSYCCSGIHHYTAKKKKKGFFISIPFIFCRVAKMRKTVKLHLFFLKHVLFGALVVLTWHLCLFQLSPLGRIIHVSAFFGNGLHPPLQEDVLLFNELLIRGFRSAPSAPSQEGTLISYGFSFGSSCK